MAAVTKTALERLWTCILVTFHGKTNTNTALGTNMLQCCSTNMIFICGFAKLIVQ